MRRIGLPAAVAAMALLVAACGGESGGEQAGATTSTAGAASDATGTPGADGPDNSYGSAVFVISDTRYEFAIGQFGCSRRENELGANGDATDGSEGSFLVRLPLTIEEWDSRDSHIVRFSTPGSRWQAIGPTDEGSAYEGPRVDDFEIDGTTVTGTFWVVDREVFSYIGDPDELELVEGTFEITCNEW